jgi:hypothetical protein
MTTINQLPLLTTLSGGDNLVVWSPNNGDSRRVPYSFVKADIRAGLTLTDLPAATIPLAGTEEMPIVQGGISKRTAINNILNENTIPYIANGLGSVSAPSYTFTGDLNTGMWSPGADTIAFSEGGAEAMRITSAGNVGIGTTAPAVKLEVSSAFDVSALNPDPTEVRISTTTISSSYPTNKPWGRLSFYSFDLSDAGPKVQGAIDAISSIANGGRMAMVFSSVESGGALIERMRIADDGNVGIGTASPTVKLDVIGNANFGASILTGTGVSTGDVQLELGANRSGNGLAYVDLHSAAGGDFQARIIRYAGANGGMDIIQSGTGGMVITNEGNADTVFKTNALERMRIDSSGNVGIGTSSPSTYGKFAVAGTGVVLSNIVGDNTGEGQLIYHNVTAGRISVAGAFPLIFQTNSNERFRITSTGGITSSDLSDAVGYKGLPQNAKTASYTLALSDMGKHISITTGGVVIPANGSVAFPIGSTIVIYNDSASTQNITITTDTLRLAGTATTGTRSLAQRGLATCVKVLATEWVVSGNVT